jgi:hypothetical protein
MRLRWDGFCRVKFEATPSRCRAWRRPPTLGQIPMRRTVTGCAVATLQSTSRASARAVDVRAAVAGLARHGICSGALVPRRPRHMPRRSSRSLGCAGDRPSAAPSAAKASAAAAESPRRPGWTARLRWGVRALSADFVGNYWVPHPRLAHSSGQRVGFKVARKSSVKATRHEPPRPCTVAG